MEGLAVIGVVLVLIVVGYVGVSAVLRRMPASSLRLPTGPIPDTWHAIVEQNVALARGLSSDERERLLRLVQVFLADKHFEGCGGLVLTEEMKVTIAAEASLLLLHLEGPCYPTLRTVLVYPHEFVPKLARSPGTGEIAPPPARLMGESWGDGVVVISWDDAVRGARNPGDGDNVVLHEFAHQLDAEDGVSARRARERHQRLLALAHHGHVDAELAQRRARRRRGMRSDGDGAGARAGERLQGPARYAQLQQFYRQDPARRAPPPPPPPPPPAPAL